MTFISTTSLPPNHVIESEIKDPVMTDYTRFLIAGPDTLIFLSKIIADKRISSKEDEPGLWLEQAEFPINSIAWIVDTIENKFGPLPSQGGVPNDTLHIDATFSGEQLRIRYVPKCSDDGEKGIKLQNLSRPAVNGRGNSQSVLLPNKLIKNAGLLDALKKLNV